MIEEENEKIAICSICLETLTTNIYFASDDHMYHKNSFSKLNFKNSISRQDCSYYLPVNKVVKSEVYFENNFKTIIYDLYGFNQDGFNRNGFDRNGFNLNGIDENGFNRNKDLFCEEKIERSLRENPWNIYYACEAIRGKYELMKECVEADPNTYENATLRLKQNVGLAILFFERGGSFSLVSKHLRNNKQVAMIAVEKNPNSYQYVVKNSKDDEIFK